mmetsp:Transcript_14466/g.24935  ORF Transcript_14466/g.24935 Transcript_14466/m.24935 type:complete len:249 (-) Transcript_14466:839-1585(-)
MLAKPSPSSCSASFTYCGGCFFTALTPTVSPVGLAIRLPSTNWKFADLESTTCLLAVVGVAAVPGTDAPGTEALFITTPLLLVVVVFVIFPLFIVSDTGSVPAAAGPDNFLLKISDTWAALFPDVCNVAISSLRLFCCAKVRFFISFSPRAVLERRRLATFLFAAPAAAACEAAAEAFGAPGGANFPAWYSSKVSLVIEDVFADVPDADGNAGDEKFPPVCTALAAAADSGTGIAAVLPAMVKASICC